ncbi:hypothetical protein LINPERHAP1_LOCUS16629, partial [Linum perenne]
LFPPPFLLQTLLPIPPPAPHYHSQILPQLHQHRLLIQPPLILLLLQLQLVLHRLQLVLHRLQLVLYRLQLGRAGVWQRRVLQLPHCRLHWIMLVELEVWIAPRFSKVLLVTTLTLFRTMPLLLSTTIIRRILWLPAVILEALLLSLAATQVRYNASVHGSFLYWNLVHLLSSEYNGTIQVRFIIKLLE